MLEACFPQGPEGDPVRIECSVHDREKKLSDAPIITAWTFADHAANDRQAHNRVVDRAVARLYAAIAERDAVEANRRGDYAAARNILEKTAQRIEGYAGDDPELGQIAQGLRELVSEFAHSMDSAELKSRHYASYTARNSREVSGKAQKY